MIGLAIGIAFLAFVIGFCVILVFSSGRKTSFSIFSPGRIRPNVDTFWRRQLNFTPTEPQKRFDLLFGAFLPFVCFFYDPLVFRNSGGGFSYLGNYRALAYSLAAIAILMLAIWEIWGTRLGAWRPVFSGVFALSAAVSLIIGVVMLPFSLLGLIVIIGALGFTPFIVVFIYARAAWRAFPKGLDHRELAKSLAIAVTAFGAIAVGLWSFNQSIRSGVETILEGDPQAAIAEARKLRFVRPLVDSSRIGTQTCRSYSEKRETHKEAYRIINGRDFDCPSYISD